MPARDSHLLDLQMQARYHRDRHRLYAARVSGSQPTSLSKLEDLRRVRELAEGSLRRVEADQGQASSRGRKSAEGTSQTDEGSADRQVAGERIDLQREADEERPWTIA